MLRERVSTHTLIWFRSSLYLSPWSLDNHHLPPKAAPSDQRPHPGPPFPSNSELLPAMTHLSPAVFGMWSVCSVLVRPHPPRNLPPLLTSSFAQLTAFCFYHMWHYDRFKCLRMNNGPHSGTFKRLMTVRSAPPALGPELNTRYSTRISCHCH